MAQLEIGSWPQSSMLFMTSRYIARVAQPWPYCEIHGQSYPHMKHLRDYCLLLTACGCALLASKLGATPSIIYAMVGKVR